MGAGNAGAAGDGAGASSSGAGPAGGQGGEGNGGSGFVGGAPSAGADGGSTSGQAGYNQGDGGSDSEPLNTCSGHLTLLWDSEPATPGEACGPCADGTLVCSGPNSLDCSGESPPESCPLPPHPNACGQVGLLIYDGQPASPGEPCGPCGDGHLACGGSDTLVCAGGTPAGYCDNPENAPNDCYGLGPLLWGDEPSSRGVRCGPCMDGELSCTDYNHLTCVPYRHSTCTKVDAETTCAIPSDAASTPAPPQPDVPDETPPHTLEFHAVPLQANALVSSRFDGKLYVSVPSSEANGNSVAVVDPHGPTIEDYIPVGSEPARMSLTDDGQFLWVYESGSSSVSKIELATRLVVQRFPVGTGPGSLDVGIAALPNTHDSVIVGMGFAAVYDRGTPRRYAATGAGWLVDRTGSPALAFGFNTRDTGWDFNTYCMNDQGVFRHQLRDNVLSGSNTDFVFADGRVYGGNGTVFDAKTGQVVGSCNAATSSVTVDTEHRRIFYAGGYPSRALVACNMDTFAETGRTPLGGNTIGVRTLVRWGRYGLAYLTADDNQYPITLRIVRTPLVP
jgi:hypothetical protein